jgi:hypothetical protein
MHPNAIPILAGLALAAPLCAAPAVLGKPCLFSDYFAEWRTFPVILRDPAGNLTCGRNRLNNGGATQAPAAAGNLAATATRRTSRFGPQGHFTYRDGAGNLHDLWFDRYREKDRWHAEKLNNGGATTAPSAAGDPSGAMFREEFHVVYRDHAGAIQDLWDGDGWHSQRLNLGGATGAPMAAGDPVQLVQGEVRHVFYRDAGGTLRHLRFDGAWDAEALNQDGRTNAPAAAGDPAAAPVRQACHVVYRDVQGGIQDLWFNGVWQALRLNAWGATDAPPALGEPCVRAVAGRVEHVTYRDLGGNLQDLGFDGAWRAELLTGGGATDGPPAASDPVCLVPPSNWEYVAYVDAAGEAQLLSRAEDGPWRCTWLNAPGLKFIGGAFVR